MIDPLNDYNPSGMGDLGISVNVKIPKPVTDALKQLPDLRQEFKQAGSQAETQASRALATGESIVRTVQVIGVTVAIAAVIAALLIREKK